MKTLKHISAALLCVSGFSPALAQYDQSVAVEGKYTPEIIPLDRIGVFPTPVRFGLETSPLEFSLLGVNANFTPNAIPAPATAWKATKNFDSSRGYVELGAGSYLNSTLSAGYRFIDSGESLFGIRLQHNSTSLWHPRVSEAARDTRRWRYDEAIGLYGAHTFEGAGRLEAAADYHFETFNYYGYNLADAPTQGLNDAAARIGWFSPEDGRRFAYRAEAGVRYFGYRRLYMPGTDNYDPYQGARETQGWLKAGVSYATSSKSSVGLDLEGNLVGYTGLDHKGTPYYALSVPDTYGTLSLTPFYRFSRNNLNLGLGARIDLAFHAGPEADRYNSFHIAPQVTIDYNAGPATLYLHLLGGSTLHTLASGYELDYYQMPAIFNSTPVYTPLDGKLGVSFGPFSGFGIGADFAYRISKGQYTGGWYQGALNWHDDVIPGLPTEIDGSQLSYEYSPETRMDLKGFSISAHADYDLGRWFKLGLKGSYQPQNGTKGYFNGYDRPRWLAEATAESNPWSTLKVRLAYSYRGVRGIALTGYYFTPDLQPASDVFLYRLPDITLLNLGVSYQFSKAFGAWIQADNLLNRRVETLPCLPSEGITLSAGVSLKF